MWVSNTKWSKIAWKKKKTYACQNVPLTSKITFIKNKGVEGERLRQSLVFFSLSYDFPVFNYSHLPIKSYQLPCSF